MLLHCKTIAGQARGPPVVVAVLLHCKTIAGQARGPSSLCRSVVTLQNYCSRTPQSLSQCCYTAKLLQAKRGDPPVVVAVLLHCKTIAGQARGPPSRCRSVVTLQNYCRPSEGTPQSLSQCCYTAKLLQAKREDPPVVVAVLLHCKTIAGQARGPPSRCRSVVTLQNYCRPSERTPQSLSQCCYTAKLLQAKREDPPVVVAVLLHCKTIAG